MVVVLAERLGGLRSKIFEGANFLIWGAKPPSPPCPCPCGSALKLLTAFSKAFPKLYNS